LVRWSALAGVLVAVLLALAGRVPPPAAAAPTTITYSGAQTVDFLVPANVTYVTFDLYGAADALRSETDVEDVVVEFIGLALAYQQAVKVFHDTEARRRVLDVFARRLEETA
jgi:hypothetical protein